MEATKVIMSVANSIRFVKRDSLLPSFYNRLTYEELFGATVIRDFSHTFFQNDNVLIQVKAGLSAVVTIGKTVDGVETMITLTDTTTYPTFVVYDYLVTLSKLECSFFTVYESGSEVHKSENVDVIEGDETYLLHQWANLDLNSNNFEFDYLTTTAQANVNFMRVKGQLLEYEPTGEQTLYDNQDITEVIKATYYDGFLLELDVLPRQIAKILGVAAAHDEFQVNEVAYLATDLPDFDKFGSSVQFSAKLKVPISEGMNTHDIGFDCDSTTTNMIENKYQEDASGAGTFSVSDGYGITQIIAKITGGTPVLKIGKTVGGEEIFRSETIVDSIPPMIDNNRYVKDIEGAWTIYYEVSGGTCDIFIQTMKFNPTV